MNDFKTNNDSPTSIAYSTPEQLVQDFASRGLVILAPESLGIPLDTHSRIYELEKKAADARQKITPELIPDIFDVINAPGVVAACNQLVGENWAIVPFMHPSQAGPEISIGIRMIMVLITAGNSATTKPCKSRCCTTHKKFLRTWGQRLQYLIHTIGHSIMKKIMTTLQVPTTSILSTNLKVWKVNLSADLTPSTT